MFKPIETISHRFSPELRKIAANTSWLFADRILRMGVGLVVGVWVARYLGPEQFGLYNYAIALIGLFEPLSSLGLTEIGVRELVRDPSCKDEIVGTSFVIKLVGGMSILLLAVGPISLLNSNDNTTRWLLGIVAAQTVFKAFEAINFWFLAQTRSKNTVIATSTAFVFSSLAKIALIQIRAPLIAFACTGFAEMVLFAVILTIIYRINGNQIKALKFSFSRAKQLLKEGCPLLLASFTAIIYMRIDQIMLNQMAGSEEVGIYSAAVRLSENWYFIPTIIIPSVFPSIIKAKQTNEKLYYQKLQSLFNLMAALSFAIAIPMTFLSGWLVNLIYGKTYAASGLVLAIHIWSAVFVFFGCAQAPWNVAEKLQRLSFTRGLSGAVINVTLNLILIPLYGAIGASIATLISYAVPNYLANLFNRECLVIFKIQSQAIFFLRTK